MGWKGALLDAVITKTIQTIASHSEIKASSLTIENKKGEISPAYDYLTNSRKDCFILESGFFNMYSLKEYRGKETLKYHDYDGTYKVFDKSGNLIYLLLEKRRGLDEEIIGKDIDKLYLFDLDGKVLGKVKEHFVSINAPILENDSKKCSIYLADNKLCNVRRYYSIGKVHFKTNSGYSIEHVKSNDFVIKKGSKPVLKIIIFRSKLKKYFPRSVVVEYESINKQVEAILFAVALDSLCAY